MFEQIYQDLKSGFNQSWFKFFFQYTILAKLLEQPNAANSGLFFKTYFSSWWWVRLWFRACIQNETLLNLFDIHYKSLCSLKKQELFNENSTQIIINHPKPLDLNSTLTTLEQTYILDQKNFNFICEQKNISQLVSIFSFLQQASFLTATSIKYVIEHDHPNRLVAILTFLKKGSILNAKNIKLFIEHSNPSRLASALYYLDQALILNQDNFYALMHGRHSALLQEEAAHVVWSRITFHHLTQADFLKLLTASEHANPLAELERVTAEIIGIQGENVEAQTFNDEQSTHRASIHYSVSQSATKLMSSYGKSLNFEQQIQNIKDFVYNLEDTPKHLAAKHCIKRITEANYTFTDISKISISQLLTLVYAAIHDEDKRKDSSGAIVPLENAKTLFIEGLYEIQRGYNLNALGVDLGGKDQPICSAGTFNKLVEKLNGIHQDVEIYFITHEGASYKFTKLAQKHALNYLNTLSSPKTAVDFLRTKSLLDRLKADGSLEGIWNNIKEGIQASLWEEFSEAYKGKQDDYRFVSMINNGHYLNIMDLSEIENKLMASSGYQAYLEEKSTMGLEQYSLWNNRHTNSKKQLEFDKQYALSLHLREGLFS